LRRPRPVAEAISSAGGVRLEALDAGLMLRTRPGVFAAGELLDWEAPTGGYLLTACFASGLVAAEGAIAWPGEAEAGGRGNPAVAAPLPARPWRAPRSRPSPASGGRSRTPVARASAPARPLERVVALHRVFEFGVERGALFQLLAHDRLLAQQIVVLGLDAVDQALAHRLALEFQVVGLAQQRHQALAQVAHAHARGLQALVDQHDAVVEGLAQLLLGRIRLGHRPLAA